MAGEVGGVPGVQDRGRLHAELREIGHAVGPGVVEEGVLERVGHHPLEDRPDGESAWSRGAEVPGGVNVELVLPGPIIALRLVEGRRVAVPEEVEDGNLRQPGVERDGRPRAPPVELAVDLDGEVARCRGVAALDLQPAIVGLVPHPVGRDVDAPAEQDAHIGIQVEPDYGTKHRFHAVAPPWVGAGSRRRSRAAPGCP